MQLMEEIPQQQLALVFDQQAFKAGMRRGGFKRLELHMIQEMDRVRGHNPVDQPGAEIKYMLYRVHRHA